MTVFDLLFIAALLASAGTLLTAAVVALRGKGQQALRILRNFGICAAVYLSVAIAVAYFSPQRVIRLGDPWCFDDWCLSVNRVDRVLKATLIKYDVGFRIFSRAGRASQRAKGAWIYLIDDRGRRYSPDSDPSSAPLDIPLKPGESVGASRVFQVPADVHKLGLTTGHSGPYCGPMDLLIIGSGGCLFNKPAMIQLP